MGRFASAAKIGILELDNGKWLATPPGPGFKLNSPQLETREDAILEACDNLIVLARLRMTDADEGVRWSPDLANTVTLWAQKLIAETEHPSAAATSEVRVTDDRPSKHAGGLNHPVSDSSGTGGQSAPEASAPLAGHSDGADANFRDSPLIKAAVDLAWREPGASS